MSARPMKINFEKNINGFQEARKLKIILEHYAHSDISDKSTVLLVESMITELNEFISDPEFASFSQGDEIDESLLETTPQRNKWLDRIISIWRTLFGPSQRELLLSKQRLELLERAERAESMAFDALTETAEVGRQRDAALRKLKELESSDSTGNEP